MCCRPSRATTSPSRKRLRFYSALGVTVAVLLGVSFAAVMLQDGSFLPPVAVLTLAALALAANHAREARRRGRAAAEDQADLEAAYRQSSDSKRKSTALDAFTRSSLGRSRGKSRGAGGGGGAKKGSALPAGWEEHKDENNETFYFCPETNVAQWEMPVADAAKARSLKSQVSSLEF